VVVQRCFNVSENFGEVFWEEVCAVLSSVLRLEGSNVGKNFGVAEGCCTGAKNLG
jgi:hypothetical protein